MKEKFEQQGIKSQEVKENLPPTVQKADPEFKNKGKKQDATEKQLESVVNTKKLGSEYWLG